MRTKTLLLAAAAVAAGIATSQAQVFSVNAVGYVNKTVPAGGFALLANPLIAPTNTVQALVAPLPDSASGLTVFVWQPGTGGAAGQFQAASWDSAFGWSGAAATATINPGQGFFIKAPAGTNAINLTFIGDVPTGTLNTTLQAGLQIVSSQVPQAGKLQTDLGYNPDGGDTVYQWDTTKQGYVVSSWDPTFLWSPAEPTLDVGDAIFLQKAATAKNLTWTRTFNVNQ
jgi:hypothetical protein